MSQEAFQIYEEALKEQHTRNEARRIRTRVDQARQSPHSASGRWPFELLQNALDAGPRADRSTVTVRLSCEPTKVVFEHDGAPFSSDERAALLSGGTSKEFDSDTTTGRFGTGFLVTHVLAQRTRLCGLLRLTSGCELFDLTLDRGGDEDAILANIQQSHEAIRAAVPVSSIANRNSAVFEYETDETDAFALGLQELRQALPYLFGTRSSLGRVELRSNDGLTETWEPSPVGHKLIDGENLECRTIVVTGQQLPERELQVLRFLAAKDALSAALILVEQTSNGTKVILPDSDAPRVFREYPIRSSGFLPINFIFDGKFDPDQERGRLLMSANDRDLLSQAFSAAEIAVQYSIRQGWRDSHWLARADSPDVGFDAIDAEETEWWTGQLGEFAGRLAAAPIVECEKQFLPAITDEGPFADFIVPHLLETSEADETSVERLWPLVAAVKRLLPPRRELASDWTSIGKGWHSLGVEINKISTATLPEWVGNDAKTIEDLEVEGNVQEWLAVFFDIVGECWSKRAGVDLTALEGIMPNQSRRLCSPSDLKRDDGVSEDLKDICADIEYHIRHELLLNGFDEIAKRLELSYINDALVKAVPSPANEDDVVAKAVERIGDLLPEGKDCSELSSKTRYATVRLFSHLWVDNELNAASVARQVPLLASSQRAARWSPDRMFMAPVRTWPESARPFESAYPPDRVLDDMYAGSELEDVPDVSVPLAAWGVAYTDPVTDVVVDLRNPRLAVLNPNEDCNGVVVAQQRMSQIALLQPELLNRCQEEIDKAKALLGLVLCCVAKRDQEWKEWRTVEGRRSREDVEVSIPGALWLADLKVRAWIPVPGEDDKPQKIVANEASLKYLLNPLWLQNNDDAISLLSEWFGFDQLELRLLGIVQDPNERQELRDSLAELVEMGGADPQLYSNLAQEVEVRRQRKHDVEQCRALGLAVQSAIGEVLRRYKLDVKLVDKGFDYEVALRNEDILHDTGSVFDLGPYLVEVKATTSGPVRLTPKQAATAASARGRYVLCVVDLRRKSEMDLEEDWGANGVEGLARFVHDIGNTVGETYEWVEVARTLDVGIRNESALRYEVPPEIWESGVSITDWVEGIKTTVS
ncbi:MAG: ATP-binding protein [Gemmatimonadetes bacterium]|nr:ATP-binding protein [Gemmatimonadota bacterium]